MGNIESNDPLDTASTTPAIQIMAIWALALIPMAWGFINTVMRAAKLFH